jgi:hypothetical protein
VRERLLVGALFATFACAQQTPVRAEVDRIAALKNAQQRQALRELLVDSGKVDSDPRAFREAIFYHEGQLRPALRSLLNDAEASQIARFLLSTTGSADDLRLMIQHPPPVARRGFPNRWTYAVATSLLEPKSDEEWNFLRKCAENDFEDRWVDYGAIQTLKLIASDRSRQILEESSVRNEFRRRQIATAVEYIQSNPQPLACPNLTDLAKRVAEVVRFGDLEEIRSPCYDELGDKALVDFVFHSGLDRLTYTATFHLKNGVWKLRGVRETLQEFMPPPPPPR